MFYNRKPRFEKESFAMAQKSIKRKIDALQQREKQNSLDDKEKQSKSKP